MSSLRFTGDFKSFFRLWCENNIIILLSIGILFPWTILRVRRYWYQHTCLQDSSFAFTAKPARMFVGIWVGVGLWVGLNALFELIPTEDSLKHILLFTFLFNILTLPVLAFFTNQALSFRRYHSNYRGLRFFFAKDFREAVICMAGFFLLSPLSLFIAYPYFKWRFAQFRFGRTAAGQTPCEFSADLKSFYHIYWHHFVYYLFPFLVILSLLGIAALLEDHHAVFTLFGYKTTFLALFTLSGLALMYYLICGLTQLDVQTINLIWNHLKLGPLSSSSHASLKRLIMIRATNFFIVSLSFGLLSPLAKVRTQRFWIDSKSITGDLESFIATLQDQDEAQAVGEGVSEAIGLDLGI